MRGEEKRGEKERGRDPVCVFKFSLEQPMVYQQPLPDVSELTHRLKNKGLIDSWSSIQLIVIDPRIDHWRFRHEIESQAVSLNI